MSWTDVMPCVNDAEVLRAIESARIEDIEAFESEFGIDRVRGRVAKVPRGLVSISLFCKSSSRQDGDVAVHNIDVLKYPKKYGHNFRYVPWDHYVTPLLKYGPLIIKERPDLTIRIYLANDLSFLVDELSEFAEVCIMKHSSDRSAPGMLWRYLALDERRYEHITILDADVLQTALVKIALTEQLAQNNLGLWRSPASRDYSRDGLCLYRPMAGCFWGTTQFIDIRSLLLAHRIMGSRSELPSTAKHPQFGTEAQLFGSSWPDYGSDEYFLTLFIYPRLVESGTLTIVARALRSYFLLLDIEYCTWANKNSCVNFELYPYLLWGLDGNKKFSPPEGILPIATAQKST